MKVAVIGAGISGAVLANKLHHDGVDVTVIEKSRGRGGRMSTKRLAWGNCDMGAQYFTVRDARVRQIADDWVEKGLIAQWNFKPSKVKAGVLLPSIDHQHRYVATPEMNTLAKQLLDDIKIQLNTRVHAMTKEVGRDNADKWYLWDEHMDLIGVYDWVVSTIPAEQAKDLFEGHPEMQIRIPNHVHDACWAVTIATRGAVDGDIQGVFGDDEISWFARQNTRPNRGLRLPENREDQSMIVPNITDVWNIHFSPEFTERNAGQPSSVIEAMAFDWLQQLLSDNDKCEDLVMVESYSHFWRFARPSERYLSQSDEQPSNIIIDETSALAVIGDWTCGGRVEGAIVSALECYEKMNTLAESSPAYQSIR